jgi:excisionase family DNA binding protein
MTDLLSVAQAAERLGLSPSLIRRYCRQGRLGVRVGGRWVISSDHLEQFVKEPRSIGYPKGRPRK